MKIIEDGEPCDRTCASHVTHSCEECGRLHMIGRAVFKKESPFLVQSDLDFLTLILSTERELSIYVNGVLYGGLR